MEERVSQWHIVAVATADVIASAAEPLETRLEGIATLAREDGAFDVLFGVLARPGFCPAYRVDEPDTVVTVHIAQTLAKLVTTEAAKRLAEGLHSEIFAVEWASALALRGVTASEVIEALTARVARADWFNAEVIEACLDALREAGPAAAASARVVASALGLELTGQRAAIALAAMGEPGHRALVEALASLEPIQGAWSAEDWEDTEPRDVVVETIASLGASAVPLLASALPTASEDHRYFIELALREIQRTQRTQ